MQMPAADDLYPNDRYSELLVSGLICPQPPGDMAVAVKRDMLILTSEGQEAGRVAAVVIDRQERQVTHILLSRRSQPPEYRLVPISLIEQVQEEKVLLRISNQAVDTLTLWHGS